MRKAPLVTTHTESSQVNVIDIDLIKKETLHIETCLNDFTAGYRPAGETLISIKYCNQLLIALLEKYN